LKIAEGDRGAVLTCHAGCRTEDVVSALGLKMIDLFADQPPPDGPITKAPKPIAPPPAKGGHYTSSGDDFGIVATFDYRDVDGSLLYQVVRKEPKKFLQRRPDGAGGWIWKVAKQVKRVPYRLPDLLACETVFVVEGEKDADRLWNTGIPATCNAGGAGKWGASESKALASALVQRVIIIPDNDDAGHKHAHDVAAKCKKANIAVSIVELPDAPHHGDVSDWLNSGGTKDGLLALAAVPYVLPQPTGKAALPQGYSGPVLGSGHVGGSALPAPASMVEVVSSPALVTDGLSNPTQYGSEPSDVGMAESFRDRYGDRLRYDHQREQWFMWSGNYWRPDHTDEVRVMAVDHLRLWRQQVEPLLHYPRRDTLIGALLKRERRQSIENMLTCATWLAPISTDGKTWNQNPWLFGVSNGVVDLQTGVLLPGLKEHHITQSTDIAFDPEAKAPRWRQFIDEVFDGDMSLQTYVQRAAGYSLTADMREQIFFMCVGTGANGKSIFLDTLEYVFGDYGHRASMMVFTGDAAKFHVAEMEGKRLIVASETKPNTRLNEYVLKNFTGGESQSAERKGSQPFTFTPIGKIWMGVNHEPKVADDSYGFWRRVRLIPFGRTFKGESDDPMLRDKLRAEAPGILQWCVEGCDSWRDFGLVTPPKVMTATERYQQQENPLADFFAEKCELDADATTTQSAIIAAYSTWCDDQGIRSYDRVQRRTIIQQLEKQFVIVNVAGMNRVRGIKLVGQGLF
jgi:putative DNA primase/helicase